ncbi:uncharacterized protein LOC143079419 [Mytilus galloprovincialis]|uniref:uncharacterized protein LOC143079419 n=1 Tax=Mytilus galloprovincialis TaxID=29158 RepID=UPI003F7C759F
MDRWSAKFFCPPGDVGRHAHPTRCAQFYDCDKTMAVEWWGQNLRECPYPEVFNESTHECDSIAAVRCNSRQQPMDPCDYLKNQCRSAHCVPCHIRFATCRGLPDGLHQWRGRELTSYFIVCQSQRVTFHGRCQSTTPGQYMVFSPMLKTCVDISTAWTARKSKQYVQPKSVVNITQKINITEASSMDNFDNVTLFNVSSSLKLPQAIEQRPSLHLTNEGQQHKIVQNLIHIQKQQMETGNTQSHHKKSSTSDVLSQQDNFLHDIINKLQEHTKPPATKLEQNVTDPVLRFADQLDPIPQNQPHQNARIPPSVLYSPTQQQESTPVEGNVYSKLPGIKINNSEKTSFPIIPFSSMILIKLKSESMNRNDMLANLTKGYSSTQDANVLPPKSLLITPNSSVNSYMNLTKYTPAHDNSLVPLQYTTTINKKTGTSANDVPNKIEHTKINPINISNENGYAINDLISITAKSKSVHSSPSINHIESLVSKQNEVTVSYDKQTENQLAASTKKEVKTSSLKHVHPAVLSRLMLVNHNIDNNKSKEINSVNFTFNDTIERGVNPHLKQQQNINKAKEINFTSASKQLLMLLSGEQKTNNQRIPKLKVFTITKRLDLNNNTMGKPFHVSPNSQPLNVKRNRLSLNQAAIEQGTIESNNNHATNQNSMSSARQDTTQHSNITSNRQPVVGKKNISLYDKDVVNVSNISVVFKAINIHNKMSLRIDDQQINENSSTNPSRQNTDEQDMLSKNQSTVKPSDLPSNVPAMVNQSNIQPDKNGWTLKPKFFFADKTRKTGRVFQTFSDVPSQKYLSNKHVSDFENMVSRSQNIAIDSAPYIAKAHNGRQNEMLRQNKLLLRGTNQNQHNYISEKFSRPELSTDKTKYLNRQKKLRLPVQLHHDKHLKGTQKAVSEIYFQNALSKHEVPNTIKQIYRRKGHRYSDLIQRLSFLSTSGRDRMSDVSSSPSNPKILKSKSSRRKLQVQGQPRPVTLIGTHF